MNKTILKIFWAFAFLVCALLGLILQQPEGAVSVLLVVLGVAFFVPPFLLLYQSIKDKDLQSLKLLRRLSILSLSLSAGLMVANFLCVLAPDWVGNVLYWTLAVVGTPMPCLQSAYVSLFAWAILLFSSMEGLKEAKK